MSRIPSSSSISVASPELRVRKSLSEQVYQPSGSTMSIHRDICFPDLQSFVPFLHLNADFDISSQVKEVFVSYFQERLVNRIRSQIADLSADAENYLLNQEQVATFVDQAISTINHHVRLKGGLPSTISIAKWTDVEAPAPDYLEIVVKVALRDYDTLFRLWEMVDEEIYKNVPSNISENVVVKFKML